MRELSDYYSVERFDFTLQPLNRLKEYAGIVIARPTQKFSEYDKYKLDQYVMGGGKLLWFIDPMIADMVDDDLFAVAVADEFDDFTDACRLGVRVGLSLGHFGVVCLAVVLSVTDGGTGSGPD